MMMLDYNFILAIGIGMARLFPCFILIPAFSFEYIKGLPRYGIIFALALLPAPGIRRYIILQHLDLMSLGGLAVKELLLGSLLGIFLAMPFWLFESVGALFDSQRGALMGGQVNPNYGPSDTPSGRTFRDLTVYLMVIGLGFYGVVRLIWDSYQIWPPTLWFPHIVPGGYDQFLGVLNNTLHDMILYAAPFVVLLIFIDFGMGVMNIFASQLNVYMLSSPLKSVVGFVILVLYLPTLTELITQRIGDMHNLPMIMSHIIGIHS